jgi:uridine kinase
MYFKLKIIVEATACTDGKVADRLERDVEEFWYRFGDL